MRETILFLWAALFIYPLPGLAKAEKPEVDPAYNGYVKMPAEAGQTSDRYCRYYVSDSTIVQGSAGWVVSLPVMVNIRHLGACKEDANVCLYQVQCLNKASQPTLIETPSDVGQVACLSLDGTSCPPLAQCGSPDHLLNDSTAPGVPADDPGLTEKLTPINGPYACRYPRRPVTAGDSAAVVRPQVFSVKKTADCPLDRVVCAQTLDCFAENDVQDGVAKPGAKAMTASNGCFAVAGKGSDGKASPTFDRCQEIATCTKDPKGDAIHIDPKVTIKSIPPAGGHGKSGGSAAHGASE